VGVLLALLLMLTALVAADPFDARLRY